MPVRITRCRLGTYFKLSACWLLLGWTLARVPASRAADVPVPRKPNVIVIVADDLGWGELGCYGGREIPTPHIDSLARSGVRCTDGYVSCPVCSPTRAGLLTGRYQQRFGHEFNPGPPQQAAANFGLPEGERTLADRLRAAGYATGLVGKWHLGYREACRPLARGFDEFFGFLGGGHSYLPGREGRQGDIFRGTEVIQEPEYLTDALAREAVAFIDRHQAQPFFLYLTFNAVHAPLQATESYRQRFASLTGKRQTFAAMLSALDDAVGRVRAKLSDARLDEQTLIVFVGDNGGPTPQTTSGNGPLRGHKTQVFEGGIRVPFLISWPGHIMAGSEYAQPVIALDIAPTALAAAGTPVGTDAVLDGVDLLPFLSGKNTAAPHEQLYWRFGPQWAIRAGNWKLCHVQREGTRLFNLASDVGEAQDLSAEAPEKVRELSAAWQAWNAQLHEPLWDRGRNR